MAASTYTENGQVVLDQKVILGEQYLAAYSVATAGVSLSTTASHSLEIMAGASLNVRIRRIEVFLAAAGTAAQPQFILYRLSSAGTGGTVYTPTPMDPSDPPSGATAMTLPTVKGTEGVYVQAVACNTTTTSNIAIGYKMFEVDFDKMPRFKSLLIPAGASNGIAIKMAGSSTAQVFINVWFTEAGF
jgi:hypothetical protein